MTKESRQVRRARERAEAKARRRQQNGHDSTMTEPVLTSFYWGYQADLPQGLEVSNITFMQLGMGPKEIEKVGKLMKGAVDVEIEIFKDLPGKDVKGYVAQQWYNLHEAMKKAKQGRQTIDQVMPALIMFACAVSTLVCAGEIEQSEYNGDKFGHTQYDKGLFAAMNQFTETIH